MLLRSRSDVGDSDSNVENVFSKVCNYMLTFEGTFEEEMQQL